MRGFNSLTGYMKAYGSEIHHAAGGAGKSGRKRAWTKKIGGSCGRIHQHCSICHPGTKNGPTRARRAAQKEADDLE